MITQQAQARMDNLEAAILALGIVPQQMRLYSFNGVIGVILPLADGGTIELEYEENRHCEYTIAGKSYISLSTALSNVDLAIVESVPETATAEAPIDIIQQRDITMITLNTDKPILRTARKPLPRPVLRQHQITEWAFNMGTISSSTASEMLHSTVRVVPVGSKGTVSPDWGKLMQCPGHKWVGTVIANSYTTTKHLDEYFQLGTKCRPGTPYSLVRYTDDGVQLSTTPLKVRPCMMVAQAVDRGMTSKHN